MRPLTEDETRLVFDKLYKFLGKSIKQLVDRPDEPYSFRLQRNRVFYVREDIMRRATNVSGDGAWAPGGAHFWNGLVGRRAPASGDCWMLCSGAGCALCRGGMHQVTLGLPP